MRLWKRKWFVLSDYCLFYYKGEPVKSLRSRPSTAESDQINLFRVLSPALSLSCTLSDFSLPISLSVLLLGVIHAGVAGAEASSPSLITLNNKCATCRHMPPRATQTPLQPGITPELCLALFPLLSFNKWPLVDAVNNRWGHERKCFFVFFLPALCLMLLHGYFLFYFFPYRQPRGDGARQHSSAQLCHRTRRAG